MSNLLLQYKILKILYRKHELELNITLRSSIYLPRIRTFSYHIYKIINVCDGTRKYIFSVSSFHENK